MDIFRGLCILLYTLLGLEAHTLYTISCPYLCCQALGLCAGCVHSAAPDDSSCCHYGSVVVMRHHGRGNFYEKALHGGGGLLIVSEGEPIDIMAGNTMAGSQAGMHGAGAESLHLICKL